MWMRLPALSREVEELTTIGLDHLAHLGVRNIGEDLDGPLPAVGPVRVGVRVVGLPQDPREADLVT